MPDYTHTVMAEVTLSIDPTVEEALYARVDLETETGREWLNSYYPKINTPEKLRHWLVTNAVYANTDDVGGTDGFADLPRGAVTLRITHAEVEF